MGGQAQLEAQLQQLVKLGMKASDAFLLHSAVLVHYVLDPNLDCLKHLRLTPRLFH